MSNVIKLSTITRVDLEAEDILQEIAKTKPEGVFVIAWHEDGEVTYHSNIADGGDLLFQTELWKHKLLNMDFMP